MRAEVGLGGQQPIRSRHWPWNVLAIRFSHHFCTDFDNPLKPGKEGIAPDSGGKLGAPAPSLTTWSVSDPGPVGLGWILGRNCGTFSLTQRRADFYPAAAFALQKSSFPCLAACLPATAGHRASAWCRSSGPAVESGGNWHHICKGGPTLQP